MSLVAGRRVIGWRISTNSALKRAGLLRREPQTHLAQVASRARGHMLVEKSQDLLGTTATVTLLAGEARVQEIARMLGGDPESRTSREHARELLGA